MPWMLLATVALAGAPSLGAGEGDGEGAGDGEGDGDGEGGGEGSGDGGSTGEAALAITALDLPPQPTSMNRQKKQTKHTTRNKTFLDCTN
jgi:hypothetical protein